MDTTPALIHALLQAHRYPHAAPGVQLVQTHISWVLLAGAFAYKIKKPVALPFLDFSTLALRKRYCEDELRLNQRFSPDIYLDVVGIFNTVQDPRLQGEGQPIEYAVKMRRFDEALRLDHVCAAGALKPAHLSSLADTLVAFHAQADRAAVASRFGRAPSVVAPMYDNLHDLCAALPQAQEAARLAALQDWTKIQDAQLAPLMEARRQAGWVRECHGDLHLANLVLLDQRVRLFDCIEFNEDLRWIDVASEIAFTYMDLLAHAQPGMANWFVNEVLARSGDYAAAQVLRFYAVYRALVRAKVATLRMQQTAQPDADAMAYIALAERLATPPPLRLTITHGLSGCGKTTVTTQLLQSGAGACTLRLRSDVERKRLFGLAASAHSQSGTDADLYAPGISARTYQQLHAQAHMVLRAGWSVVVDATFLKRADRDMFRALAQATGAAFGIVAPQATPEQLRQRIAARVLQGQDASEATLEVLERQIEVLEPLGPDESAWCDACGGVRPPESAAPAS